MILHQFKIPTFFSCNGNELASFYDQNHDRLIRWILMIMTLIDIAKHHGLHNLFPPTMSSNHKNSMAGQTIILEAARGDEVSEDRRISFTNIEKV